MERLENAHGVIEVSNPMRGVLCFRATGHLDEAITVATLEILDRTIVRDGAISMFVDWEALSGYDTEARRHCTDYVLRQFRVLRDVHVLVRSPIVAMGVSTANLVTKPVGVVLTSYRERVPFEAVLARACASST